jgi:hypothetical protein
MNESAVLPVFVELLQRADLQRIDALVYGALCVLDRPTISDIARAIGNRPLKRSRSVTYALSRLRAANLITMVERPGMPWDFEVHGPLATIAPRSTTYVHRVAS